jgi:hypothetical protein
VETRLAKRAEAWWFALKSRQFPRLTLRERGNVDTLGPMDEKTSPIEQMLGSIESALVARRVHLVERVRRVELALESYRRAVESELATDFAREHGFKLPARSAIGAGRAAELLKSLVDALPELQLTEEPDAPPTSARSAPLELGAERAPTSSSAHPLLTQAAQHAKIVVIGALSGRDRASSLPPELSEQFEWVDTEREGAHAVGNLPQRIRQKRVAGVVILDRAVQHRHTEPVLAAARDAGVPFAFAGQGGKASIARALDQLETALGTRTRDELPK